MIKHFEINENILKKLINPILETAIFEIYIAVYYDKKSFGNTYIVLKSKRGIKIEFIADNREQLISCNILGNEHGYDIEDFFQAFNIPLKIEREDFLNMIKEYSATIYRNKDRIFELFDERHKINTINVMNEFYKWRNEYLSQAHKVT